MLYFVRISTRSDRFNYTCYYVNDMCYTFIQEQDVLLTLTDLFEVGDLVFSDEENPVKWTKFE